jgi:hypothetical protein
VFLLTDGKPEGEFDPNPDVFLSSQDCRFPVHVIGFGYDTHAALLRRMSLAANSPLAFISDASMAASTMANIVAHASQAVLTDIRLVVAPPPGLQLAQGASAGDWVADERRACGYLVSDQTRRFLVKLDVEPGETPLLLRVFGEYRTPTQRESIFVSIHERQGIDADFEVAEVRQQFVTAASDLLQLARPRAKFDDLMRYLERTGQQQALLAECRGQIEQALGNQNTQSWERWGESYVAALARAHELEYPLNFKDESTKGYCTPGVSQLVSQALEVFQAKSLPAPPKAQKVDWSQMVSRDSRLGPAP